MKAFTVAQCFFWLREPGQRGGFRYTRIDQKVPSGEGMPTTMPPAIGDLAELLGVGMFRVVDRKWLYPAYGSMYWPYGQGPAGTASLVLVVERAEDMFVDEERDDEVTP